MMRFVWILARVALGQEAVDVEEANRGVQEGQGEESGRPQRLDQDSHLQVFVDFKRMV